MRNKTPLIMLGVIILAAVFMGVHKRSELELQRIQGNTSSNDSSQTALNSLNSMDNNKSFQERFGKAMRDSICNDVKSASEIEMDNRSYSDYSKLINMCLGFSADFDKHEENKENEKK